MDWLTTLRRSGGINALSRQVGVSPAEVSAGVDALLPPLLWGLREFIDRQGGGDEGAAALVQALIDLGGGQLAADVMGPGPLAIAPGNAILDFALGPDVARRAVLIEAERTGGIDQALGERILPGMAMLIGGYITARAGGSGAEGSGGVGELDTLLDPVSGDNDTQVDRI